MNAFSKYIDQAAPIVLAASFFALASSGCGEAEFVEGNGPGAMAPVIQPGGACIGVDPEKSRELSESSGLAGTTDASGISDDHGKNSLAAVVSSTRSPQDCKPGTCLGQPAPEWKAYDYQPLSCGYGKEYGIQAFAGQPVLMVNLAGWCPYCQSQAEKLEKMRLELEFNHLKAHIIIVNSSSADNDTDRGYLTQRCSLPLFQDTDSRKVWDENGGGKDDFYFYDHQGALRGFFPHGGEFKTNLSVRADYEAMRERLFDLARAAK